MVLKINMRHSTVCLRVCIISCCVSTTCGRMHNARNAWPIYGVANRCMWQISRYYRQRLYWSERLSSPGRLICVTETHFLIIILIPWEPEVSVLGPVNFLPRLQQIRRWEVRWRISRALNSFRLRVFELPKCCSCVQQYVLQFLHYYLKGKEFSRGPAASVCPLWPERWGLV